MSLKTVSPMRIERAQRALFEALGQIAIIERMLEEHREPGPFGQGERGLTIPDEHERFGSIERRDVREELRRMAYRLQQIDDRLEELKTVPVETQLEADLRKIKEKP